MASVDGFLFLQHDYNGKLTCKWPICICIYTKNFFLCGYFRLKWTTAHNSTKLQVNHYDINYLIGSQCSQ